LGFVILKTKIGREKCNKMIFPLFKNKERTAHRAIEDPFNQTHILPLAIVYTHSITLIHVPE
jgi:hypothetical protein